MAEVRIKVGASIDPSMRLAFRPLVQGAVEARKQILGLFASVPKEITAAMGGLARAQGGTFRGATREAQAAFAEQTRAARQAAKEQTAAAREARREEAALARRATREIIQEHRALEREQRRIAASAAAVARRQHAEEQSFARRTSHRTTRFLMPNMPIGSMARRATAEIARGFGVDPTVSGAFQRNVELETLSQQASNSARLSGQNIDPAAIEARVRDVSNRRGMSRTDTAEGVFGFQKLTGDLGMGLSLLDRMAERAAATSTSVADYAAAMGNVSNALGDIPDKEKRILEIMDAITVQGARGAVEVSDMATHMARVAAAASKFGGDRAHNIKMAGALVQMSRAEGGAPSAAEASRSIVGFANTFRKSARLKEFQAATGKSAFTDSRNTELRGMAALIKDALVGTGGDLNKMNKIFMDVIGARAVDSLTNAFNKAGGGEKGLGAVDAKLGRFTDNTSLSQGTLDELNAQRDKTTAAKVQRFQNTLDDTAKKAQESLLPALERLTPAVLVVADVLGSIVKIAAENPGAAIVAAIVGSIARAGLESAFRNAIERSLMRGTGAIGGAPGGAPVGGAAGVGGGSRAMSVLGAGSVGLGIGSALGTAIFTSGVADVNENMKDIDASARETGQFDVAAQNAKNISPKQRRKMRRNILDQEEKLKKLREERHSGFSGGLELMMNKLTGVGAGVAATGVGLLPGAALMGAGQLLGGKDFTGRDARIRQFEGDIERKRASMAEIDKTRFERPDQVSKYVASDPSKHSRADLQKAFDEGGIPALEKIATLTTGQKTVAENMLTEQKATNAKLDKLIEKIPATSGRDPTAPAPDEEP